MQDFDVRLNTALRELDEYAESLDEESQMYWRYHRSRFARISMLLCDRISGFLPGSFRSGMTVVLQKAPKLAKK